MRVTASKAPSGRQAPTPRLIRGASQNAEPFSMHAHLPGLALSRYATAAHGCCSDVPPVLAGGGSHHSIRSSPKAMGRCYLARPREARSGHRKKPLARGGQGAFSGLSEGHEAHGQAVHQRLGLGRREAQREHLGIGGRVGADLDF